MKTNAAVSAKVKPSKWMDWLIRKVKDTAVAKGSKAAYAAADGWKDFKKIVETSVTSIDTISKDDVLIQTNSNGIEIESNKTIPVVIYSISGQKVYESNIQGNKQISLSKGVYIVKADQTVKKVVI